MAQSSIEWLVEQVNSDCLNSTFIRPELIAQAKEMHKQEMIKFTNDYLDDDQDITAEQYYNKTFGGNNEL